VPSQIVKLRFCYQKFKIQYNLPTKDTLGTEKYQMDFEGVLQRGRKNVSKNTYNIEANLNGTIALLS
jgi:hypothetical protein